MTSPRALAFLVLLGAALPACNADLDGCTGSDDCQAPGPGPTTPDYVSLAIEPADALLQSDNGSRPTQAFRARGTLADGTVIEDVPGLWSLSGRGVGAIEASQGLFTATGEAGGQVEVRVEASRGGRPMTATARLTVSLRWRISTPGTPGDAGDRFKGALPMDAGRAASIAYPLDGVVMPQNVFPADIQWLNGAAGNLFRIRIVKPHCEIEALTLHSGAAFKNDWLADERAWRALAQSDVGQTAALTVDRWLAAEQKAYAGAPVTMRFAPGSILGSIYYWDILAGRSLRIDDGKGTRVNFMPTPPASPTDGSNCLGCHVVSRDGRYLAGHVGPGNGVGVIFDLTQNLSQSPAPSMYPVASGSPRWFFASFSPDSKRLLTSEDQTLGLRLYDPMTGALVKQLPDAGIYPSWSPDGRSVAYISGADQWGSAPVKGNLAVLPVTGADAFGAGQVIHRGDQFAGAAPMGNADSYPSWSPDSRWIAFGHGSKSRSEDGLGALYLVAPGGGAPARLTRGCGGAQSDRNYLPNFSPFDAGGYFWMSFLSKRDYGNAQAGTRGADRQQVWVMAIKNSPKPGEDPSEVGYWLPGQDVASRNISAYWAPRACRKDAEVCTVDSECCSGRCVSGRCEPPPPAECRTEGQPCGGGGCCAGLLCQNNVCIQVLG